jgi:hypothetical protein
MDNRNIKIINIGECNENFSGYPCYHNIIIFYDDNTFDKLNCCDANTIIQMFGRYLNTEDFNHLKTQQN